MKLYVYEGTVESMMQHAKDVACQASLKEVISNSLYSRPSLCLKTYRDECNYLVNKEIHLREEEREALDYVDIDPIKTMFANVGEADHGTKCFGAFVVNRENGNNNCYVLVDKDYRGLGLAEYLVFTGLENAINGYDARLKLTDKCRWVCSEWNSNSKRLAVRLGMTLVDQIEQTNK